MDLVCGYYHPERGDQRHVTSVNQVFDTAQMRARPLEYRSLEEQTTNLQEIVLDNPNHVKEFLYNIQKSSLRAPFLVQQLAGFDQEVLHSLCDRGAV